MTIAMLRGRWIFGGNQEWAEETEKGGRFAGRPLGFAVMTEVLGCREAGFGFWETALRQGQRQGEGQGQGQGHGSAVYCGLFGGMYGSPC